MNAFWSYFWPLFALGAVTGAVSGIAAFRRRRPWLAAIGAAVVLAGAAAGHGPLGAAERLTAKVESPADFVVNDWEMGQVEARLHRGPLSRRLLLSGPADDFQRSELVRIMSTIPGVSTATWGNDGGLPLLAEAAMAAVAGFLIGLLLAYGVELRRRYNAQWRW